MSAPTMSRPTGSEQGDASLSLNNDEIQALLPHRWPMLLLDRVHDVVPGVSGRGVKCVSAGDSFFNGHFPGHAVMPGVLIVEALAQLSGVVLAVDVLRDGASLSADGPPIGYLGSLRQIKFTRLVRPGDVLDLHAEVGRSIGGLVNVTVAASVDRERAVSGSLAVSVPSGGRGVNDDG